MFPLHTPSCRLQTHTCIESRGAGFMTCSMLRAAACRWAGLIRGAVSVALVYYYFDPKGQSEDSHRATLIATTLVVVMFSITVFGAVTKPLLDFTLGMGRGGPTPRCKHPFIHPAV